MKLEEKYFDERQTRIRGKIFRDSLALLSFLFLINGFLEWQDFIFADPLTTNALIILLSLLYCDIRLILNDAYISNKKNQKPAQKATFLILIFILIFYVINYHCLFTKDNLLSNQTIFFATVLIYVIRSLILYIKAKFDSKNELT